MSLLRWNKLSGTANSSNINKDWYLLKKVKANAITNSAENLTKIDVLMAKTAENTDTDDD